MKHTFAGDPDKHILLLVIRSVGVWMQKIRTTLMSCPV